MAYVQTKQYASINFTDEDDQIATKIIDIVPGAAPADAIANAADMVAAYAAVSTAAVKTYLVTFVFYDSSLTPGADSEVQARASVVVDLVTDATHKQEYGIVEIPSPVDGLFLAASGEGKNIVDITDGNLNTLVGLYASGGSALLADRQNVEATNPIVRGKRLHRASTRG